MTPRLMGYEHRRGFQSMVAEQGMRMAFPGSIDRTSSRDAVSYAAAQSISKIGERVDLTEGASRVIMTTYATRWGQ